MDTKRKGIKKKVITGLVSLIAIAGGVMALDATNEYFNAPISYDSDGKTPLYTQMISETNKKEGYRKAKFGADVNAMGGMNSMEEMHSYPSASDYDSVIEKDLAKRVVETPSKAVLKRGFRNATKYTGSDGSEGTSFNGSGMDYWLKIYAFDRDEIKNFEVYEIDPDTREKVRKIDVGDTTSGNFKWGKFMCDVSIGFSEGGVGEARLLRLEVTDRKDNKYHSFIELKEKKTFFDYIVEDIIVKDIK